ncbi:uncharacterized protein LOC100124285 [Nasonia vitripennis]|uniref:Aminopeptidase N n=1 Tax=Nasonia vitripennis TaxID=7425 RepID=A0A7M7QIJ2_NASVI|nr:uncharacterized protein LOC100124285 [Nasonia vitripennis]
MESKMLTKMLLLTLLAAILAVSAHGQNSDEKSEKANEYRLPKSVVPLAYDLRYSELNFTSFTFTGTVDIDATVAEETREIVLNAGNLAVHFPTVTDEKNNSLVVDKIDINRTTEKYWIFMKESLNPSQKIKISLSFDGVLRDDMIGFYRSSYFDGEKERWLASTQFESTHARHAFPCFDEPAFKAKFSVRIFLPRRYGCLMNMPTRIEKKWCIAKQTVPMSTYLVAFVISDFSSIPSENSAVTIWSRPDATSQAVYGREIGNKILEYFGKQFNETYHLPKMDMVAVPDFSAGAMENWGLITYRETAVLYDEKDSSAPAQQRVASVIVHECAHMWFGNLVTPEWWSYLWLSEAFARYFQYIATAKIEPSWKMDQQFVVEQHQIALGVDGLESSEAMTRPAITQSEIGRMGDSITYSKGGSIVRMMEKTFGHELFYTSLRNYLKKQAWDNANPGHLWQAFQNEVDKSGDSKINVTVSAVMKTWTEQPGFPYISVTIKPDYIDLSQQRFLLRNPNTIPTDSSWWVPITWASSSQASGSTKPVYWLADRQLRVKNDHKDDDWLILNVESAGFYRVNYDKDSWNRIIKVLTSGDFEKIHELNRAAIVDDLLNLARAGILNYDIALQGIQYLKREKNYLPFKSAFTALDYLIRQFSGNQDDDLFKEHVLSLIENVYNDLTYDDKDSDDQLTVLLRQEVNGKACSLGHSTCVKESKSYFDNWRTKNQAIPKNQRPAAYCTALKHGTKEDWEFLWTQYEKTNAAAEQVVILAALGCTKDTTVLEKYLLKALTSFQESKIRKQDISSVFSGVYSASPENAEYMLDFVEKHYEAVFKYHNSYSEIASLISGALSKYPSEKLVQRLENIIKSNATHVKSIIPSLQKTLKLAQFETSWLAKNRPIIVDWIKALKGDHPANENTTAYRLPTNVIPSAYTIHLTPFIVPGNFTFRGSVKIIAKVNATTDKIVLHTDMMKIDRPIVTRLDSPAGKLAVKEWTRTKKYHFTNIHMEQPIVAGSEISIEISYTGQLNAEMRGFYRSSYKVGKGTRWLAATHLEPVGARRLFPCFDEPALKATFDISVDVPENYKAVSNMPPKSPRKSGLWEFERTPVMSTYLVAVVVSDFESKSLIDGKGRLHGVWASPVVSHQLNYSLEVMPPIVDFFESRLGHNYNLPKLEMVALPDFASGAMENWGLLTFRETNMLYDPERMSSLANKQSVRNVIAHEITHQWFGDLVSPLWWDYLWLSEGFARYFQCHAYSEAEKDWNLEAQFVVDHLQTSFSNDASTGTHAVTTKVYSPAEIRAIFDKISYAKAASLIRMLEKLTGEKVFYAALKRYLEACKFSTGTPEALFEAFQTEVNADKSIKLNVTKLMNTWTRQSGFPVVKAELIGNSNVVKLSQQRFYLRPSQNTTSKALWYVPINWATKSDLNFQNTTAKEYLSKKMKSVEIKNAGKDWVIINVQQTGYYRVNYDETLWRRIIDALNSDEYSKIHELNRASLIDDLLNLGRAGHLDYDLVLDGVSYLTRETEYAPWKAAFTGLTYLNWRFFGRPEINGAYRTFLLDLLEPSFERLGFADVKDDRHQDVLLRKTVNEWLCGYDHEGCVKEAIRLFEKERNDTKFRVPPNQRDFAYCTAIRHGSSEDWDYLYARFIASNYATEKMSLLSALSCSKTPSKLQKLLMNAITIDSEIIRLQDVKKLFSSVIAGGLIGVETILDFIGSNYNKIAANLGDDIAKSTISTIAKRATSTKIFKKFENFVESASTTMPSIAKSLQSSLKRAKLELDWYTKNAPKILQWLDKNNPRAEYRLPTFAKPKAYDIHLEPNFEDFTFKGRVEVDVEIKADTLKIVLQAKDLDNIRVVSSAVENPITQHYNDTTQKLSLYFKEVLTAGTTLRLSFDYTGHLRDDMRGFYRSYYVDEAGKTRWIASTQFEPAYARRAFPCFDEPLFKATFAIHIAKPKGYRTLSNMGSSPVERKDDQGRIWDDYEESLLMSPYLVAFVVSDFEKFSEPENKVAVWARPQLKKYLRYAPRVGLKAIRFLEKFTKIDYPLDEMNFVAVPDFDMGAMENWGLVTYREYGLTYDIYQISASYKRYVNTVVSHELVHMWFGNLVTCEWWDYTWLNEGFAEYLEYIVSNASQPGWRLLKQFVVNELQVALQVDASASSHSMNNKVNTPKEAQAGFDKIAYQKSSSVLRMLHHSFGQSLFEEALHNYLDAHKYQTARPEYLVAAIQAQLDKEVGAGKAPSGNLEVDVATAMNSWITQAGYPVVKAYRRHTGAVLLSQERFLSSASNSSERSKVYWTPITYTSESKPDFENTSPKLWLGDKEKSIDIPVEDTWYLLNVQQIGYYRVNYDSANWHRLVELLNSEDFQVIGDVNRAQIIDDLFSLAQAGYVDYDLAFNASRYFVRETDYLPWKAHFNTLAYLSQRIDGLPKVRELYARHVLTVLDKVYKKLGFKENMVIDPHLDQLNRELILGWACKYGHEDCVKQSKEYFKQKSITSNIAGPVYCTAIEHGTSGDWDALWKKYTKAVLATDYITILKGLGCSKNATVLQKYLDLVIAPNSPIRRQDVATAFSSVYASSQIGLQTTITFFQQNLEKLYEYFGAWHEVGDLFTSLAGRISTLDQIESIKKVSNSGVSSNIKSSIDSAVKTARKNLEWYQQNSAKIEAWLNRFYGPKETTSQTPPVTTTTKKPEGESSTNEPARTA